MRNLALRQLRPVFTFTVNPSRDADDLEIFPAAATLYFSASRASAATSGRRSFPVHGAAVGDKRGREASSGRP